MKSRKESEGDFLGGPVVKNPSSNEGDMDSIPGWAAKTPTCNGASKPTCHSEEPSPQATKKT